MEASPELLSFWQEPDLKNSIGAWDTHPGADPLTEKVLQFLANLFDYQAATIAQLDKSR